MGAPLRAELRRLILRQAGGDPGDDEDDDGDDACGVADDAPRCAAMPRVCWCRRGTPLVGLTSSARVPMWWQHNRGQTIHIETAPKEPAREGALRQRERHARLSGTLADDEDERSDIYGDDAQRQGLAPRRTSHCWIVPDGPQCNTVCALY